MKRLRGGPIQPHHFKSDDGFPSPPIWSSPLLDHGERTLTRLFLAGKLEVRVFDDPKNVAEGIENSRYSDSFADVLNRRPFLASE